MKYKKPELFITKRKRDLQIPVRYAVEKNEERWLVVGNKHLFKEINNLFRNKLIKNIKDIKKSRDTNKHPIKLFFIGVGKGQDILGFKKYFQKQKIKNKIDVFNLKETKLINGVNKDYSMNDRVLPFEYYKNKSLEKKYDFIVSGFGAGAYTNYPELILIKSALMLNRGGTAYIEYSELTKKTTLETLNIFKRFIRKEHPELSFEINNIKKNNLLKFIEIKRKKEKES